MSINLNNNACDTVELTETTWTAKIVEEYFLEVISTLKKLPPVKQRGYFNSWPDIIYTPNELMFQEKIPKRLKATPEAISRIDKVFNWMIWITVEERKLIWKRARNIRWQSICQEFGYNRITAWRKWNIGLKKIAKMLNNRKSI